MIGQPPIWANNYKQKLYESFTIAGAGIPESAMYNAATMIWNYMFVNSLGSVDTVPPTGAPPVISANATPGIFMPNFQGKFNIAAVVAEIVSHFQAVISSMTWPLIPPAPPFSAITFVNTAAFSIPLACSTLQSQLTTTFSTWAIYGAEDLKYLEIGQSFYSALMCLQVEFIGFGYGSPPPPLVLYTPVF